MKGNKPQTDLQFPIFLALLWVPPYLELNYIIKLHYLFLWALCTLVGCPYKGHIRHLRMFNVTFSKVPYYVSSAIHGFSALSPSSIWALKQWFFDILLRHSSIYMVAKRNGWMVILKKTDNFLLHVKGFHKGPEKSKS
jgi:hypothetical protein